MKYLLILIVLLASCDSREDCVTQKFEGEYLETTVWVTDQNPFLSIGIYHKKDYPPITKELIEMRKIEANKALEDYKRINRLIND